MLLAIFYPFLGPDMLTNIVYEYVSPAGNSSESIWPSAFFYIWVWLNISQLLDHNSIKLKIGSYLPKYKTYFCQSLGFPLTYDAYAFSIEPNLIYGIYFQSELKSFDADWVYIIKLRRVDSHYYTMHIDIYETEHFIISNPLIFKYCK